MSQIKNEKTYTPENCETDDVMFFEDESTFRPYVRMDGKYTTYVHDKEVRICIHDNRESSQGAFWHGAITGASCVVAVVLVIARFFI